MNGSLNLHSHSDPPLPARCSSPHMNRKLSKENLYYFWGFSSCVRASSMSYVSWAGRMMASEQIVLGFLSICEASSQEYVWIKKPFPPPVISHPQRIGTLTIMWKTSSPCCFHSLKIACSEEKKRRKDWGSEGVHFARKLQLFYFYKENIWSSLKERRKTAHPPWCSLRSLILSERSSSFIFIKRHWMGNCEKLLRSFPEFVQFAGDRRRQQATAEWIFNFARWLLSLTCIHC